ncbi:hypothetical protein [Mycobacterium sp. 1423905.2]|uniref:GNAT family N-acetyltransferase, cg3035/Rv0428c family n=1 Tax=Mycobacterium sp. 1423905.2 TaxID=1856859 RepID=UPI0007FC8AD7|nr:hypothetical protein [Mycobacterium sp. 1423905.2]OBJ50189.1 hypothetical protein A9W95_01950 [Mycobacterium sp. 1423905.2]
MTAWPELGTRVTVRYRLPHGSSPPLSDAVGHLVAVHPAVRVRIKTGAIIECAPADVVAVRVLTDAPVRTSDIRNLEHAAAGPGTTWLHGWLLRAGDSADALLNSAVPLEISADITALPAIVDWYRRRDLIPRLAIPDRLLTPPAGLILERTEQVLVRDVPDVPVAQAETASTLKTAPDGTRWVGLSKDVDAWAHELARAADHGATRAYVRAHRPEQIALAQQLGFKPHHRSRYFAVPAAR